MEEIKDNQPIYVKFYTIDQDRDKLAKFFKDYANLPNRI